VIVGSYSCIFAHIVLFEPGMGNYSIIVIVMIILLAIIGEPVKRGIME